MALRVSVFNFSLKKEDCIPDPTVPFDSVKTRRLNHLSHFIPEDRGGVYIRNVGDAADIDTV
jgi:hypothetical protein